MLAAGDELGHSQDGNNNPYCQDNATTWIDWAAADDALIGFTARAIALRRALLPLADRWYSGAPDSVGLHDLGWLREDGQPLSGDDWRDLSARCFGALIGAPGKTATPLLLLFNGDTVDRRFSLPAGDWHALLDTVDVRGRTSWRSDGETPYALAARSVVLLASEDRDDFSI